MRRCLYRTRQFIFSLFVRLVQNKETKLIRGSNSILEIPDILEEKNCKNILIVTTNGFIKRGSLDGLFDALKKKDIKYACFTNVNPDPSVTNVEDGYKEYRKNDCEGIVAIGGGSVLDCAKIIGARVSNPRLGVRKMKGMLKIRKKLPLYIPVPTTCGTGSEVTAAAVITDTIYDQNYKYAITDLKLIPDIAILDSTLLKSLPDSMLVTTTMDALTHAIEAYINLFGTKQVTNDSLEAVKLIFNNIDNAFNDRDNESLDNLLYASTLAGISITHNFVGYVHALAHAMGAIYHLPHGYLNSIILPVILKMSESKIEKKMKALVEYCGLEKKGSYTDTIISRLNEIRSYASIDNTIKELKEEDFEEIIIRANKEANPTYPVPYIFSKKDFNKALGVLKNGGLYE